MTYDYMKTRVIDLSYNQGDVDFYTMKGRGIEGVILRCTQSNWDFDPRFTEYWDAAGDAGLVRGVYFVVDPRVSADKQVSWFLAHFNDREPDIPFALDCEIPRSPFDYGLTRDKIADVIKGCGDLLDKYIEHRWAYLLDHYSAGKMIYTSPGWWNSYVATRPYWRDEFGLWQAQWTGASEPTLVKDWSDWWLWQWSSRNGLGKHYGVSSHNIDLNRVHYEGFLDHDDNDNGNGGNGVTNKYFDEALLQAEVCEDRGLKYIIQLPVLDFDDYEPPVEPPPGNGNGEQPPVEPPLSDGEIMYAAADDRDDILALQEVDKNDKGKMIMGFYPDGEPADQRIRVPNGDAVYVTPDNITVDGGSANDVREWIDKPDDVSIKLYFWKRWLSKTKPE